MRERADPSETVDNVVSPGGGARRAGLPRGGGAGQEPARGAARAPQLRVLCVPGARGRRTGRPVQAPDPGAGDQVSLGRARRGRAMGWGWPGAHSRRGLGPAALAKIIMRRGLPCPQRDIIIYSLSHSGLIYVRRSSYYNIYFINP